MPDSHPVLGSRSSSSNQSVLLGLPPGNPSLVRPPSHTLPPVLPVLQDRAFETMMTLLRDMGFGYEEAEVALAFTRCVNIEAAVDFLSSHPDDVIMHAFQPSAATEVRCLWRCLFLDSVSVVVLFDVLLDSVLLVVCDLGIINCVVLGGLCWSSASCAAV